MIDDKNKAGQLVGEVILTMTASATARSRMNLALHHLFAACRFGSRVMHVEQQNAGQPFGDFWDEIFHNALGVVTLTVASMEAFANEMYFEGEMIGTALNSAGVLEIAELVDRKSILRKYQTALAIRSNKGLNFGAAPVQNVDALVRLRNAVVHYRPEWTGEKGEHEKLSKRLQHLFAPSLFLPQEPLFPRAWATGSCAAWALHTTVDFIDYFYAEVALLSPLEPFRAQLSKLSEGIL